MLVVMFWAFLAGSAFAFGIAALSRGSYDLVALETVFFIYCLGVTFIRANRISIDFDDAELLLSKSTFRLPEAK